MKKIADISSHQGVVDWSEARAELDFCILRASCGENMDDRYLENVAGCVRYGIPFGAYHFVKAQDEEAARREAQFFVGCVCQANRPNFYVADIETQTEKNTEQVCIAFLEELRRLGCRKVGMYINTRYKWAGAAIAMCDFVWIPHWGKNKGAIPEEKYKPKHSHDLWQYTSKGTLSGVKGNIDLNQLTGTRPLSYFIASETEENKNMPARINTPFTNEHLVAFCKSMLGQPYWYGTCAHKCSQSLLTSKTAQYPTHYTSGRLSRYKDDIAKKKVCADCVGLIKGYMWTNGGIGVTEAIGSDKTYTSKYGSNNCPDKSANGMFEYAKSKGTPWGTMDTLPEIPGLALRLDGHVGVYIGDGYAIEERGFNYGCVQTKVTDRNWTHWYALPFIDYGAAFSGKPDENTDSAVEPEKADTIPTKVKVCSSSGASVNIRTGNGTTYSRITTVKSGTTYDWVATARNGWHAIVINGQVGWVSGECSSVS